MFLKNINTIKNNTMEKKYMLTDNTITVNGRTFYRIVALKNFGLVKAGMLGGYIESENNLSHEGEAWVYENAYVGGNVRVYDDAKVDGNVLVLGNAKIHGNASIYGNAHVNDNTSVHDNTTCISNKANVYEYLAIIGGIGFILCTTIWALCHWW